MISKALKKYGVDNFIIDINYLPDVDKNFLIDLEEQMIIRYNSLAPNGYNVLTRGLGVTGLKHSDESKMKMSLAKIGRKHTEESKLNMSLSKKGKNKKPFSEEHKENIRKARLGTKASPEAIENMRKSQKIRANSEEGKRMTAEIMRKRYEDPKERLKLSLRLRGENAPNYGKPVPEERRKRISESLKGEKNPNYGKPAHNRGKSPSPETLEKRSLAIKKAWARRKLEIIKNSQIPTLVPVSLEETRIPQY
jgi:hypothetical protein